MSSDYLPGLMRLLGLSSLDAFFEHVWEQEPRLARGTIQNQASQILTLELFELLMASAPGGEKTSLSIVEDRIAMPVVASETDPTRLLGLYDAFHRGCTIIQVSLESRTLPVARLCREIENQILDRGIPLAESVGANAYLTPAGSQGFDIHYDNHCALILQLHGRKQWSVFAPLEAMPVKRCEQSMKREELGSEIVSTSLQEGDVLYIPRGFPHYAQALDHSSLHLTLSIRPMIWSEAIRAICETDSAMRSSAQAAKASKVFRELMPALATMNLQAFMQKRVAENYSVLRPLPAGGLVAKQTVSLDENSKVTRIPDVECSARLEQGEAVLRFPGVTLRLPSEMHLVFEYISQHPEFTPAMLPPVEADYDRVRLVQILAKRGLLQISDLSSQ